MTEKTPYEFKIKVHDCIIHYLKLQPNIKQLPEKHNYLGFETLALALAPAAIERDVYSFVFLFFDHNQNH